MRFYLFQKKSITGYCMNSGLCEEACKQGVQIIDQKMVLDGGLGNGGKRINKTGDFGFFK